jgi:hypothetical protein
LDKLISWFLLMIISVVLVAWVYKPRPPDAGAQPPDGGEGQEESAERQGKVAY